MVFFPTELQKITFLHFIDISGIARVVNIKV